MSAPGQGGDAAQQGQNGQQGGEGQGEAQQQAQPDWGQLSQQLESLAGGQEDLRQFLAAQAQQQQEPEQQQEPSAPEVDLSWLDPSDPAYDPEQMSQKLSQSLSEVVEKAIEERTAPIQERMQEERRERMAERLTNEFPELKNSEIATDVVETSMAWAESIGRPELGAEPEVWRVMFLAGRAMQASQQEGAETPDPAHLEGGGGAISGTSQVDTRADEIMNADGKKGSGVLPF